MLAPSYSYPLQTSLLPAASLLVQLQLTPTVISHTRRLSTRGNYSYPLPVISPTLSTCGTTATPYRHLSHPSLLYSSSDTPPTVISPTHRLSTCGNCSYPLRSSLPPLHSWKLQLPPTVIPPTLCTGRTNSRY